MFNYRTRFRRFCQTFKSSQLIFPLGGLLFGLLGGGALGTIIGGIIANEYEEAHLKASSCQFNTTFTPSLGPSEYVDCSLQLGLCEEICNQISKQAVTIFKQWSLGGIGTGAIVGGVAGLVVMLYYVATECRENINVDNLVNEEPFLEMENLDYRPN